MENGMQVKYHNLFQQSRKAIHGLTHTGINSDLNEHQDMALYYLKAPGEFDAADWEWENRPAGQKTWQDIKTFISAKYAKESKQYKLTTKSVKANLLEEEAKKAQKNSFQQSPKATQSRLKPSSKAPPKQ